MSKICKFVESSFIITDYNVCNQASQVGVSFINPIDSCSQNE